jgi:NTP pyrophosphatase (non-canonical NTP hydrolase)
MITRKNLAQKGLQHWEREFADIYAAVDRKRRPTDIWLLLVEDASQVAEQVRRDKYADALDRLAHVVCWTCSFVHRIRESNDLGVTIHATLPEIVWHKYPGHCSTCAQRRCVCSVSRAELEELTPAKKAKRMASMERDLDVARSRKSEIPATLDELQRMFRSIYGGAHYAYAIEAVAFHFLEEVGEVASDIRHLREGTDELHATNSSKRRKELRSDLDTQALHLQDEIADIISWSFSLIEKLDFLLGQGAALASTRKRRRARSRTRQSARLRLSNVLYTTYRLSNSRALGCPKCGGRPCQQDRIPHM